MMRRRALLIVAAGVALARPAHADVPVIDFASIAQAIKQIEWMRDQYQVMTQNLRALTNSLNLNSVAPGLLNQGIQNPLGSITGQLPGIVGGATVGNIPGASQVLQQDRLYQPAGSDFMANTMNGSATSLANLKAMAMQLIGVNEQRISALSGIQGDLEGAEDMAQVERINGRIALENQTLAAQQAQAQQLQTLAQLQQQINDQRTLQRIRSDDEQAVHDTGGTAGGLFPQDAPQPPTFVGN